MLCPSGHESSAADYCDVCGLPIPADGGAAPAAQTAPGTQEEPAGDTEADSDADSGTCPNCQAVNPANALFCEACGYDFTTGSMPRPVTSPPIESVLDLTPGGGTPTVRPGDPASADGGSIAPPLTEPWVAEIWIDPDWYAEQESTDRLPSAGVPTVVPLKSRSILVGRTSRSRGIHPDIDLGTDNGISRRHCQLTTDGSRWWVEDLGSSNGTYVGSSVGPLPEDPIDPGEKHEIRADDRLYLGAWTRLVVRKATPGEV
ncbi:FHA domain-containing protein [Nocardioides sp.]|nr:FHA domain-containing protein [Nocardioides sp.]